MTTHSNDLNISFTSVSLVDAFYADNITHMTERTAQTQKKIAIDFLKTIDTATLNKNADYQTFRPALLSFLEQLKQKNLNIRTIKQYFYALNNLFCYFVDIGIIKESPVPYFSKRHLKTYKMPATQPKQILDCQDIETLIKTSVNVFMDFYLAATVITLAVSGLRKKELMTLKIKNYDEKWLFLHLNETAKRTNLIVPITHQAAQLITYTLKLRVVAGEKLTNDSHLFICKGTGSRYRSQRINKLFWKLGEACGLHNPAPDAKSYERLCPHAFRYFLTKYFKDMGMSRSHLAELRGDKRKNTESQEWYYDISYVELKREYDKYCPVFKLDFLKLDRKTLTTPILTEQKTHKNAYCTNQKTKKNIFPALRKTPKIQT